MTASTRTLAFSYLRFSSEKQSEGDSLRRQLRLAEDYAKKHELELDTHSYQDLGISAFHGKNALEGRLGTFLQAVKEGLIPAGSYLLVESLDRLSREQVTKALNLFLEIINADIVLVTLTDEQRYTTKDVNENWTRLIMALAIMARANEESVMKSRRIRAAITKKVDVGGFHGNPPAWLKLVNGEWQVIEEKAAVVRRAFELTIAGHGGNTIARIFNDEKVPVMQRAKNWWQGVIAAMLRNEAVFGRRTFEDKTKPPIDGYFPAIISQETFYAARGAMQARRRDRVGGLPDSDVSNLFTGMGYCMYCAEKGHKQKLKFLNSYGRYPILHCTRSYAHGGCSAGKFPYAASELAILSNLTLTKRKVSRSLLTSEINNKRQALIAERDGLQVEINNLLDLQEQGVKLAGVVTRITAKSDRIEAINKELIDTDATDISDEERKRSFRMFLKHYHLMKSGEAPEELSSLRRTIKIALARQIDHIDFAPKFTESPLKDMVPMFKKRGWNTDAIKGIEERAHFICAVHFKDGTVDIVNITPLMHAKSLTQHLNPKHRAAA